MIAKDAIIVIPARLESTRLPRKLLLEESGQTLIEHTYQAARKSKLASQVIIATDHALIFGAVKRFGGTAIMTNPHAASGTDRVAEIAERFTDVEIFVNIQGDEPEIDPQAIDLAIETLASNPQADVATLATPIRDAEKLDNPNCVKVICDHAGHAMYFSRSCIPYARNWDKALLTQEPPLYLQHIGLYVYRSEFLSRLHDLKASKLEETEKLEQLRFLENGATCAVALVAHAASGIDVRADYDAFLKRVAKLR